MVLVDHTGWKLRRKQWTGTTDQFIEDLEAAYDNAPNIFSIRIHHCGKFQRYPGRMYVSGRVFDMVDIDLFNVVALNMMVLKLGYTGKSEPMFYNYLRPLTSLDEGLYALACEEDVRCLATLVRSFKLIEVYIEHGVTALDSYLRAPRFRAIIEEITDEPGSIAANRTEKMLLLTWHESSETTNEPVCDFVTPSSLPQHDSSTPLDGETGFADIAGSGVDSSSDPSNDEETNYRKRRLAELRTKIEGVINVSGQWKYSFYIGQKFTTPKEAKDRVYLHFIESKRNLKLYKNDSVRIRAKCDGKVLVFTMSQGIRPTGPNRGMEARPNRSSGPTTMSKTKEEYRAKAKREIIGDRVLQYSMLREYVVELQSTNPNITVKIAVERNTGPS
ncbi:hypothetical protein Tco_0457870 [Tanacetum coccineum]